MRRFVSTTHRASSCTRAPSAQFFLPRTTPFFVRFFALRCSRETRRGKHDSGRDVMELICEIGIYEGKKAKRRGTGRCCLKRNALRFDYQDSLLFFFFFEYLFARETRNLSFCFRRAIGTNNSRSLASGNFDDESETVDEIKK